MLAFKVKVMPWPCNQHVLKGASFTLKVNIFFLVYLALSSS